MPYKVIEFRGALPSTLEKTLNDAENDGWTLVQALNESAAPTVLILHRSPEDAPGEIWP